MKYKVAQGNAHTTTASAGSSLFGVAGFLVDVVKFSTNELEPCAWLLVLHPEALKLHTIATSWLFKRLGLYLIWNIFPKQCCLEHVLSLKIELVWLWLVLSNRLIFNTTAIEIQGSYADINKQSEPEASSWRDGVGRAGASWWYIQTMIDGSIFEEKKWRIGCWEISMLMWVE